MKRMLIALAPVAVVALFAFNHITGELPIGSPMPMPDAKMKDVTGKEISLKQAMRQNGLLVMFSCNTCPYVIKNQERTLRVAAAALENEIGVILVNSNEASRGDADSHDAMKAYADKQGYKWWYVVDENSRLADAFDADRTPECFLFDKEGKLVYHGAIDDNPGNASGVTRNHLEIAFKELLSGRDISQKETRSVGCSIKRKE